MKVPALLSSILKLVNKQHIGLKVILYITIIGLVISVFNWFQWTIGQQSMYGLEPFTGQGKEFTLFYWKDCGHCKKMMPAWNQLMSNYKGPIKVTKLEKDEKPGVMNKFGIQGFPTIMLLNNGKKVKDYEGGRDLQSFTNFLKQN